MCFAYLLVKQYVAADQNTIEIVNLAPELKAERGIVKGLIVNSLEIYCITSWNSLIYVHLML